MKTKVLSSRLFFILLAPLLGGCIESDDRSSSRSSAKVAERDPDAANRALNGRPRTKEKDLKHDRSHSAELTISNITEARSYIESAGVEGADFYLISSRLSQPDLGHILSEYHMRLNRLDLERCCTALILKDLSPSSLNTAMKCLPENVSEDVIVRDCLISSYAGMAYLKGFYTEGKIPFSSFRPQNNSHLRRELARQITARNKVGPKLFFIRDSNNWTQPLQVLKVAKTIKDQDSLRELHVSLSSMREDEIKPLREVLVWIESELNE